MKSGILFPVSSQLFPIKIIRIWKRKNNKKNRKSAIHSFIPYMTSCKEASHSLDLIQFKKGWKISCGRGTTCLEQRLISIVLKLFFREKEAIFGEGERTFFPIIEFEKRTKLYVFLGSSILKRNFCPFSAAATFTVGTFEVQHPMIFAQWPSIYVYICNRILWIMGHNGVTSFPKDLLNCVNICDGVLWKDTMG